MCSDVQVLATHRPCRFTESEQLVLHRKNHSLHCPTLPGELRLGENGDVPASATLGTAMVYERVCSCLEESATFIYYVLLEM